PGMTRVAQTDRGGPARGRAAHGPRLRGDLVRLLLAHNRRQPPAAQRWEEVDTLLKDLTTQDGPTPGTQLLQAQVLLARNESDKARELMEAERRRDPKQVGPWLFLADLTLRQGKDTEVLPLLDEAERQVGRRVEWQLARAGYWARAGGQEALPSLGQLAAGVGQYTGEEHHRLLTVLAEAFDALGEPAAAEPLWARLAEQQPGDL